MDFERLNGDIKEMRRRNRGLALTVGLLAAAHVLALVVILNLLGTVRTAAPCPPRPSPPAATARPTSSA
ncbi:MAG: hypothetical protein L6Q68_15325 [Aquabacterium sp.]|nr:hypothetical protein [Aquabacterium sp.]